MANDPQAGIVSAHVNQITPNAIVSWTVFAPASTGSYAFPRLAEDVAKNPFFLNDRDTFLNVTSHALEKTGTAQAFYKSSRPADIPQNITRMSLQGTVHIK